MYPKGGEAQMADIEFSHNMGAYGRDEPGQNDDSETAHSLATMTNLAGAVVSLALIAGVGVWGYKLMIRDVSGIPIVRAVESEMRVRPEDPGGQLAEHQGLAVNEIAARGEASGPVDQVILAPPAVKLTADDQPVVEKEVAPVSQPEPLGPATGAFDSTVTAEASPDATDSELSDRLQQSTIDDVVAELIADTKPLNAMDGPKTIVAQPAAASPDAELVPQPAVLKDTPADDVLNAPGARTSMRPRLRPKTKPVSLQKASFTPAESKEINPADIPSGTRLAQLGAFESPEVARQEWVRMQKRFGEILQNKSRVVQEAQSGGRTFYRLRAMGFVDLNDTRRFCSAVQAEGVDCIPVQVR